MVRILASVGIIAAFSVAAYAQSAFEIADVHVSSHSSNPVTRISFTHDGRYELRTANMVDLIATAHGVDASIVVGGPSWLESDRFDIIAQAPANSTPEALHAMLRALLADRFSLAIHNATRPMSAYVLTAGKHPLLKPADGTGASGCENDRSQMSPGISGAISCQNMTMQDFAQTLHTWHAAPMRTWLVDTPVVDMTGIKGSWNFKFKWSGRGEFAQAGSDGISLFEAIDKQLGLQLKMQQADIPVIVVDSVNEKPTDNLPGVTQKLPELPVEFEVAQIKLSTLDKPTAPRLQPGGRFTVAGTTLIGLIQHSWDTGGFDGMIVGAPKFVSSERFDIVAKIPADRASVGMNDDAFLRMLRALLVERFKMVTHTEDRPVTVDALVAPNPKLKKADPANRTGCRNIGAAAIGPPSAMLRTFECKNMTMAGFAEQLPGFYGGDISHPVIDATGIEGAFDFALTFSPAQFLQTTGANGAAPDPNGAISLSDALEKQLGLKLELQKHPMPVLVIDRIEPTPTDN